jgi:hypothetical protein
LQRHKKTTLTQTIQKQTLGTNIQTSGNQYSNLKKFWKDVICKGKDILFICSILICDRVGQNKAKYKTAYLYCVVDNFSNWCVQLGCPNYINTRNSLPRKKMVEVSDFSFICYFKFYDIKCQFTTICFMILLSKVKVLSIIYISIVYILYL